MAQKLLQNKKLLFITLLSVLAVTASAAYFNIGMQYRDSTQSYYTSIGNDFFGVDISLKFFNDKLSASILTPYILFGNLEFGYDISKLDFDTLYKGTPYFGISESMVINPIILRLQAEIDPALNFRLNGEVGIGF
jgi:hypothetical protein